MCGWGNTADDSVDWIPRKFSGMTCSTGPHHDATDARLRPGAPQQGRYMSFSAADPTPYLGTANLESPPVRVGTCTVIHFSFNTFGKGFGTLELSAKNAVSGTFGGGFTRSVWKAPAASPSSAWQKASAAVPFGCCYTSTYSAAAGASSSGASYGNFVDFSLPKKEGSTGDCDVGKTTVAGSATTEFFHKAASCEDTKRSLGMTMPAVTPPPTVAFRFQATRGVDVHGDIGLDDISISHDCDTHAAALASPVQAYPAFPTTTNDFEACAPKTCRSGDLICNTGMPMCASDEVMMATDKDGCATCQGCVPKIEASECGSVRHPWGSDPQCVCSTTNTLGPHLKTVQGTANKGMWAVRSGATVSKWTGPTWDHTHDVSAVTDGNNKELVLPWGNGWSDTTTYTTKDAVSPIHVRGMFLSDKCTDSTCATLKVQKRFDLKSVQHTRVRLQFR